MSTPHDAEPLPPSILEDLEQWTRVSGWSRHHVRSVERFWRALGEPRPFRVVDVGCGLGGLLADLLAWGERNDVELVLCGIEPYAEAVERARSRLGARALIVKHDLVHLGCEPGAFHLATCCLVFNQLSGPQRLRLVAELSRAATTAYVFDVTPTVGGEVGARLVPWLMRLNQAPPEAWVRTLERAPTVEELTRLVAPLPVEVGRVFPTAVCTSPEPTQRVRIDKPVREASRVQFEAPVLLPGTVGSDRVLTRP